MWSLFSMHVLAAGTIALPSGAHSAPVQMDRLMLFGFLSALVTFACWGCVRHSRFARFVFALSLGSLAAFGFASGAWPLGMVAVVAAGLAAHWWWRDKPLADLGTDLLRDAFERRSPPQLRESRLARLFTPGGRGGRGTDDN